MLNVYKYRDFRMFLRDAAKDKGLPIKEIASQARIHQSYFSRVLVNKASFSPPQLFAIGSHLGLREEELDYLLLMGELDASNVPAHKTYISGKLDAVQRARLKLGRELSTSTALAREAVNLDLYYREAITATVHMALTLDRYRANRESLAKALQIAPKTLAAELEKLSAMSLIELSASGIKVAQDFVHLDEDHPASTQNHINWRINTVAKLAKRDTKAGDYHFTVTFSTNRKVKDAIREAFKTFVINTKKLVEQGGKEDGVFSMTFDLSELL